MQSQLHIPQGIRFHCTACGHCCHQYPVPLTEEDVMRLREVEGEALETVISPLSAAERRQSGLAAFSYALDKHNYGRCSFLSDDKKCRVHDTAKPAMCKLFPYTFMHCPDGLRVGLSFASTGVLLNSGDLLAEQNASLAEIVGLFEASYPGIEAERLKKWKECELACGSLLDYPDFSEFDRPFLQRLEKLICPPLSDGAPQDTAQAVLSDMFDVLCNSIPGEMHYPLDKHYGRHGERLDAYILMPLFRAYFTGAEAVREEEISRAVMTYFNNEERDLYFAAGQKKLTFAQLGAVEIEPLTAKEQDLINRFVYVRLFSRLYFGPGFSMMPLLSGIFHLSALVALLPVALKADALREKRRRTVAFDGAALEGGEDRFERLLELVREIDRRLTAVVYSRNTLSMFELFALDPQRVRRLMVLAN